MTNVPTPIDRLIRLEKLVADLQLSTSSPQPISAEDTSLPDRHRWPADELLLTRLIRRNPEALKAYESPAELIKTDDQGVLLKPISGSSPFRLCELPNGDAVVWLASEHESWIYGTEIFLALFKVPSPLTNDCSLVLQSLPRFIQKVQGREWTFDASGEMVPKGRPFVEQAEQAELQQRVQQLEQSIARMRGGISAELSTLRSEVQLIQDQLDRVLRLKENEAAY